MNKNTLSESEELVMKCIWDSKEPLSLAGITKMVNQKYNKAWKPQTVSTFLSRLVKKGYCEFQRGGRQFFYTPLVDKREYRINSLKNFIKFWNDANSAAFVAELFEDEILTKEDEELLKGKLDELP